MRSFPSLSLPFLWAALVAAQYDVYQPKNQVIYGGSALHLTAASTSSAPTFTKAAAYDQTVLNPPAVPNPPIPSSVPVQLQSSGVSSNISAPVNGGFMGISIEMSVANQVLGRNSSLLQVAFLNLMANLVERAGWVQVRVGGNSQESAELVSSLPNGTMLAKDTNNTSGPTGTPPLEYTLDLLYTMANISKLTNTHWYLGIPFINAQNLSLAIAEHGQSILGDKLLGLQAGNEPDLYASHGHRPSTYSQFDYFGEVGNLIQEVANNAAIPIKNMFIVPSIQVLWTPESVWNTGLVGAYSNSISALAVERYPDDNCAALYPALGTPQNPQDIFINYLQHNASTNLVSSYVNSTAFAQQNGKPFIMFETNTASCSGFPGISNSFGAALWALDWALTMSYNNFSAALFHVGGQNSYYNPFTPPPSNQTKYGVQWTVGPVYYSTLVMTEILGPHNKSQVSDITQNINTPIYAIYEGGAPTKLALFNFVTDPSGASTYTAVISIGGGSTGQSNATPSQVQVKYLLADSVSSKKGFTWAGQTLGDAMKSDGRLNGTLNVTTVQCDQTANTCSVRVPAPGFALVFLTSDSLNAVSPTSTVTFPTTALTQTGNNIYIDPSMLAVSNGHTGMQNVRGATSPGSLSAASKLHTALSGALALFVSVLGAVAVARRW